MRTEVPCTHCTDSVSPPPTPFLLNAVKHSPGRGWGTSNGQGNRTVTHCVGLVMCAFPLFEGGNAVRFFHFVFFLSGPVSFVVFLSFFSSKGRFLEKFSGANFCFWMVVLVLCFLVGFCLCFCVHLWRFAPETVWKNSLVVRSGVFLGWFSLPLVFFADVVSRVFFVFSFKRQRSGSHRTPLHTHLFCCSLCLFLCPAAFVCFARFGRASRF